MANRLTDYLGRFNMLSSAQYGFQHGLSTYMALLDMQTSIIEAMDQNKFDLSKAFDTVDHNILINKLEYLGIRGVGKFWFMTNRSQYVSVRGKTWLKSLKLNPRKSSGKVKNA